MRVLFVSANKEQINMLTLPLGLGCVAAATEAAGHEVQVVDLLTAGDDRFFVRDALQALNPEVIAISVRNIDDQTMDNTKFLLEEVSGVIKDCRVLSEAPVVLGGAGYSIFPESALAHLGADMGIQGEGEVAFPVLLERLGKGADLSGVPGLYLTEQGLKGDRVFEQDLDRLPLPEPQLWVPPDFIDPELWIPVQSRRGCPMNCSYCSTATIEGSRIRKRSPAKVVQWIADYVQAGFDQFHFVDNTFNLPADYAKEICRLLLGKGLDISWRSILYPGKVDQALIRDMANAGCKEVALGFESGSQGMLHSLHKGFNQEDVSEFSRLLAECGIRQIGFLLLGGPGETRETAEESLAFADSLPLDMVKVTVGIRIYPYTALAKTSVEEGIIPPDDDLLFPRFYLAGGLEDWLPETVRSWMNDRPHWVT